MQQRDCVGVVDALKRRAYKRLQLADGGLFDALDEEAEVVLSLIQYGFEQVLQERFGQVGVVVQVGKSNLGLDHPKLGEVTRGVGVLGAERRAEGIDLGHREAVGLDVELARDGQEGLFAKKVLRIVDAALGIARQVGQIQRRHPKHLARALGIRGGDDGGVYPVEALLVEEAMHRLRQAVPNARHRPKQVRTRTQMRHIAQKLQRVRLGLDRVSLGIVDPADGLDVRGLHLKALTLALRGDQRASNQHRAASSQPLDFALVVSERSLRHDLDRMKTRAITDVYKRQPSLGIPTGSHPATDCNFAAHGDAARECRLDTDHCHTLNLRYRGLCPGQGLYGSRAKELIITG